MTVSALPVVVDCDIAAGAGACRGRNGFLDAAAQQTEFAEWADTVRARYLPDDEPAL